MWRNEQTAVQEMKAVIPFADVMKVSDEESLLLTGKNSYEEAAFVSDWDTAATDSAISFTG